jgi:hypothetical protein
MREVIRIAGIRPSCARRRTVDSLTCNTDASWRAVKNSARSSINAIHPFKIKPSITFQKYITDAPVESKKRMMFL